LRQLSTFSEGTGNLISVGACRQLSTFSGGTGNLNSVELELAVIFLHFVE
jgi:hypothetical protein